MSDLLDELDEEQRAAAMAVRGPVCIIAGAGTGKTRTVTYRLAYGIRCGAIVPEKTLAITHSKKAATELAARLNALGVGAVDARTFHAAGLRVCRQFWAQTGREEPEPAVLGERESWGLWRDTLRSVMGREPDNVTVKDLVDEVSWARSQLLGADGYLRASAGADRRGGLDAQVVVGAWNRYEQSKTRIGKVDFADLLEISASLLEADERVSVGVRSRWAHVTVDEYQDTDPAQQRLLDAILGSSPEVCVVGDPRQAIYSWKGADPKFLTDFARRYPSARLFDLTRNYRSNPQIIDWANSLARRYGTKQLNPTRPPGRRPKVQKLDNEAAEAAWVAAAARKTINAGTDPSQIAVLYRFNASQGRFEAAFARAGIPVVVAEDDPFFEREEIRSVLVPFGRAARRQPDEIGLSLLKSVLAQAGFDRDTPPAGMGAARSRWESQTALLELVEDLSDVRQRNARWLLSELQGLARRTGDLGATGVTLATLHRAKGLEWDVVFVVGVNDGAIPSALAQGFAEQEEEERLLHVGITRARHELYLTWPGTSARGWPNRPSPYLDLLPIARPPARSSGQNRAGRERTKLAQFVTSAATSSAGCAHCAAPLKGPSARRLEVCADCIMTAPGELGRKARAIADIVSDAARELRDDPARLLSSDGLLRLLDKRPDSSGNVSALPGVGLTGRWARLVADVLQS